MQILKSHPRSTASEILGGAGTGIYVLAGPLQAILVWIEIWSLSGHNNLS